MLRSPLKKNNVDYFSAGFYYDQVVTLMDNDFPKQTFFNLPENKRQRIVDTAIEEFSERGYQQASINSMVSRLNIAKGSIYQYFENKRSLFLFVFNQGLSVVRLTLKAVKKESLNEDFFTRVKKSLMAGVEFIEKHPSLYRIYLRILFEHDSPLRQDLLQTIRVFSREFLMSLLEDGKNRREIRRDIDPDVAVFILDAVLDRFLQVYALPQLDSEFGLKDRSKAEAKIDGIVELLRRGFAPGIAADSSRL